MGSTRRTKARPEDCGEDALGPRSERGPARPTPPQERTRDPDRPWGPSRHLTLYRSETQGGTPDTDGTGPGVDPRVVGEGHVKAQGRRDGKGEETAAQFVRLGRRVTPSAPEGEDVGDLDTPSPLTTPRVETTTLESERLPRPDSRDTVGRHWPDPPRRRTPARRPRVRPETHGVSVRKLASHVEELV